MLAVKVMTNVCRLDLELVQQITGDPVSQE
jgi:hypothetical protein